MKKNHGTTANSEVKYEKVNHFEVSDGDTLILSVKNCPLDKPASEELVVNNTICCVNGNASCPDFFKFWNHKGVGMVQCSMLSGPIEESLSSSPKPVRTDDQEG